MTKDKQKHICIFTQSHVSKAPRVVKEANVYANAGYQVTVYTTWYDQRLLAIDKQLLHSSITYKAGVNLLNWNGFKSKWIRSRRLLGRLLVKYFGIQSLDSLGYGYDSYLKQLEQEQADFYIGHQEMGMPLAKVLIRQGKNVAFDFEDWYSKDLLPRDRAYRPIKLLEQLEKHILERASYCYTTSDAMAKALSDTYKTTQPYTIYNSFFASQRKFMDGLNKDVLHHKTPSVYWFSQVIGKGRGLELLFDALPLVQTPFQLHLRGNISESYRAELKAKVPKHIELYLHDLVPPEELISRIAEHDLGIAFEETEPESRNYTITNKVFHYLQSGIAILATETAGQIEIANKLPHGIKAVDRQSKTIAVAFDTILSNPDVLGDFKEASWNAGSELFAFEIQESRLLCMLNNHLTFCDNK